MMPFCSLPNVFTKFLNKEKLFEFIQNNMRCTLFFFKWERHQDISYTTCYRFENCKIANNKGFSTNIKIPIGPSL